jgi:hypothetical protein
MGNKHTKASSIIAREKNRRSTIPTNDIVDMMVEAIKGDIEMTPVQATLCTQLLNRTMPTLKAVELSADKDTIKAMSWSK